MVVTRLIGVVALVLGSTGLATAQTYSLVEAPQANDCARYTIKMQLSGEMVVVQEGRSQSLKLTASADHRFRERVLAVDKSGAPVKAGRLYDTAMTSISVDGTPAARSLRAERRLTVAQRINDSLVCYSPHGPLTREELENVSEHFDTLALTGLLPGREVKVGDTWKPTNGIAQGLCQFEALVANELECKLDGIKDGAAIVAVSGKAKGIELGASATVTVTASMRFDLLKKRLVSLDWKQTDKRDQGPASPAVNAQATVLVEREVIDEPKELSDVALVGVPQGMEVPAPLTMLTLRDVKGRFELSVAREWQLVGHTDRHTVLRLMERGEFVAQVSVTPWEKVEAGQHTDGAKFRETMMASPGWTPEDVMQAGEVPNQPAGRYVFRMTARGTMGDAKVVQSFYLVANARGEQAVVTFTLKQSQLSKLGARDQILVDGLEILK
ncbi:MAG: hypothetical protein U0746_12305 [Gemmataceae bacterium]